MEALALVRMMMEECSFLLILVPFSMALAGTGEAGLAVLNVCLSVCLFVCVFVRNKQVSGLVAFWRVRV